jgi:pilus assembly protein CpaE
MSSPTYNGDSLSVGVLSVAVVSANTERRNTMTKALAGPQARVALTLSAIPNRHEVSKLFDAKCDVVIVDLDANPDEAIDLVESISGADSTITVMVFGQPDPDLLVRAMRAGAREFLAEPLAPGTFGIALVRAAARIQEVRRQKRATGKMLVFTGVKGGSGVTTIASNFALVLARESGSKVALVDLNLVLGDAALLLGVRSKFSLSDALDNENRLDSEFLTALLAQHESGLAVLAAPEVPIFSRPSATGVDAVLQTLRGDFDYVVVDAGSTPREEHRRVFQEGNTIYLVTQVSVPSLRNANRLITEFFPEDNGKVEVVLNRFVARSEEIDEGSITKALTRPISWKIPNDYAAVLRAQNSGVPLASAQTPASRIIVAMARTACGKTPQVGKKKVLGIFG